MFLIPYKISSTEFNVFVALDDSNIERIHAYDPAEVVTENMGEPWSKMRLKGIVIGYATEADLKDLTEMLNGQVDVKTVLKFMSRGFKFQPEAGDYDGPYLSAKRGKGRAQ